VIPTKKDASSRPVRRICYVADDRQYDRLTMIAALALSYFAYCAIGIVGLWRSRTSIEKALWLVVLIAGDAACLGLVAAD
jgi:hypothetical protein